MRATMRARHPSNLRCETAAGSSAATGYLEPARGRSNLRIVINALATRILLDRNRAAGVTYRHDSHLFTTRARQAVILCAGALRSPQLLELSGIGDATLLMSKGVEVAHHLPGVGANLQDHLMARVDFESRGMVTVNDLLRNPFHLGSALFRYLLFRDGLFATSSLTGLAYVRSGAETPCPDIRMQLALSSGTGRLSISRKSGLDPHSGFHLGAYFLYPRARGSTHIRSLDAGDAPEIHANYLSDPHDRAVTVTLMKLMRHIASKPPLSHYIVREVRPGGQVQTDDQLLDFARDTSQTCWHPCGTCKMGADATAVVDPQLRVRGIKGLRIVDASVMPFLVSSNTNLPVMAIAERATDIILNANRSEENT